MKMKGKKLIIWLGILFTFYLSYQLIFYNHLVALRDLYFLMANPVDLHAKLIETRFNFHETGFKKKIEFTPKYYCTHKLSFSVKPDRLSSGWNKNHKKYQFDGEIKIKLFLGNKLVKESTITNYDEFWYQSNDMDYISGASLYRFPAFKKGFSPKKHKMIIEVIKGDKNLEPFKDDIVLNIKASPIY